MEFAKRLGLLCLAAALAFAQASAQAADDAPLAGGQTISIKLEGFPPCLIEMSKGGKVDAFVSARLPSNYSPDKKYPLALSLGGSEGGDGSNFGDAARFAGDGDFILLALPFFKKALNKDVIPIYIKPSDFKIIADSYKKALDLLKAKIPNIADSGGIVVGFSNGGHTMGAIAQDKRLEQLFKYYIFVEGGAEAKSLPQGAQILLMVGDKSEYGKLFSFTDKGKVKGWPAGYFGAFKNNKAVTVIEMKDSGHEFKQDYKDKAKDWLDEKMNPKDAAKKPGAKD